MGAVGSIDGKNDQLMRTLWQSGLLILAAVVVGLAVNLLRADRLPLVDARGAKANLQTADGQGLVISLEDAKEIWFTGKALFIDARSPESFAFGHILGARNLPWEDFDRYYGIVMADVDKQTPIITYCDGGGCALSKELAMELLARGYKNVHVLVNGWSVWETHQLPIETGDAAK